MRLRPRYIAFGIVSILVVLGTVRFVHDRRATTPTDPRLGTVQQVLDTQDRDQAWYPALAGLSFHGNDLYVKTSYPPNRQVASAARSVGNPGCPNCFDPLANPDYARSGQAIYDSLWNDVKLGHPELHVGSVVILDRNGSYLSGGQG